MHRNCNINVKINHKIPVVFQSLKKNHNSHPIMQELGKLNLKANVRPDGFEKYMNFSFNSKLSFIDNFQFASYSLDSFKDLNWCDFKYLSQEYDNNVIDL